MKNKNFLTRLQNFMDSPKGRTITNYLYSWGAAIVILGTLFKLTHIAGANLMLFLGMGTEVIVFFFAAFERPYDVVDEERKEERAERIEAKRQQASAANSSVSIDPNAIATLVNQVNTVAIASSANQANSTPVQSVQPVQHVAPQQGGMVGVELLPEMSDATQEYIEQVRTLNEAIQRISAQSEALGKNMEEMTTLSRNLTGINALYEAQLRSAGSHMNNIEHVNEATQHMAEQIEELNAMYARMIKAMTINLEKQA